MYGSELRTYALSAVVVVLFGAGIGFGWHYLADSASATPAASSAALEKQDALDPSSSNPPARSEGPVLDAPRSPDLSRAPGTALDLSDEQKLALVALLTRGIANDRYPASPRVRTLRDILAKVDPKPPAPPLAPNVRLPMEDTRTRAQHRGSRPVVGAG
jgi:hypothetical protein